MILSMEQIDATVNVLATDSPCVTTVYLQWQTRPAASRRRLRLQPRRVHLPAHPAGGQRPPDHADPSETLVDALPRPAVHAPRHYGGAVRQPHAPAVQLLPAARERQRDTLVVASELELAQQRWQHRSVTWLRLQGRRRLEAPARDLCQIPGGQGHCRRPRRRSPWPWPS